MSTQSKWLHRGAIVGSVLFVAVVTLTPRSELVPQRFDWRLTSNPREIAEAVLNVVLFMPFGAALRWAGQHLLATTTLGFCLSLTVELLQRYLIPGREGELQDLISNAMGALTGWLLARTLDRTKTA